MKNVKATLGRTNACRHFGHSVRATMTLVAVLSAVPPPAAQAGTQTGTVNDLVVRQTDGLIYFTVSGGGQATGKPACATSAYWMIRDEESETGKRLYSLLLAAKISGSTIRVTGTNACTRWGDGEDVGQVRLL